MSLIVMVNLFCCLTYAATSRVIVYSMPGCGPCKGLVKYLEEHNIKFSKIDISKNKAAKKEMAKKSGQLGVPVLDYNGTIIVGFQRDKVEQLITGRSFRKKRRTGSAKAADKKKSKEFQAPALYRRIKDLEKIFEDAQKSLENKETAAVLENCLKANKARFIYETCQTRELLRGVSKGFFGAMRKQTTAVIKMAKMIARQNYEDSLREFYRVRLENPKASIEAQEVLGKVIVREDFGKLTNELWSGHSEKNPVSTRYFSSSRSRRRNRTFSPDSNRGHKIEKRDVIKAEALRVLEELVNPNELYLSPSEKYKYKGEYSFWHLESVVNSPPLLFKTRRSYDSDKLQELTNIANTSHCSSMCLTLRENRGGIIQSC